MSSEPISSNFEQFQDLTDKRLLVDPTEEVLNGYIYKLKSGNYKNPLQLLSSPLELYGRGETLVSIGIGTEDDDAEGLPKDEADKAEENLTKISEEINCKLSLLRTKTLQNGREVRDFLLRKRLEDESDFCEVRVAVVGNVDAGKSTLLGVLTHNCLDNGRGAARQKLFRHKHEIESGRTSSGNSRLSLVSI